MILSDKESAEVRLTQSYGNGSGLAYNIRVLGQSSCGATIQDLQITVSGPHG